MNDSPSEPSTIEELAQAFAWYAAHGLFCHADPVRNAQDALRYWERQQEGETIVTNGRAYIVARDPRTICGQTSPASCDEAGGCHLRLRRRGRTHVGEDGRQTRDRL